MNNLTSQMIKIFENIKSTSPLVHSITNYVTANDCANIILACGAHAIMADDVHEVEEITSHSEALNLNIGTPNENTLKKMLASASVANAKAIPIIIDLVGLGISKYRQEIVSNLLADIKIDVIKGNASEIYSLYSLLYMKKGEQINSTSKGVEARTELQTNTKNFLHNTEIIIKISKITGAIVVMTGKIDLIANQSQAFKVANGSSLLANITGAGCMLNAMTACYLGANPNNLLLSTLVSILAFNVSAQKAEDKLKPSEGNLNFKSKFFDEVYNLDIQEVLTIADFEEVSLN